MRQILALVLLSGCSLLYNPSNLPAGDARGSAGPDAQIFLDAPPDVPLADADPSMLQVTDVQPPLVYEGQGVGNSRPAVLTVRGHDFVPGAVTVTVTPTVTGATASLTLGTLVVAGDGNSLAVPVTANIMPAIGGGTSIPLTITVAELGVTRTISWSETALDELTAVTQLPPTQARYSQVALAAAGTIPAGGPRVTIHSMSSVSFAALHVDAVTKTAGAGGCTGGAPGAVGPCPGGGGTGAAGQLLAGPTAGGGAGFIAKGGDGAAGTGGPIVGDPFVASYANPANTASGGGGGGSTYLAGTANGGAGGGGGGTLEIHAEGDLTTAALTALGGAGGTGAGAAGGGGAGGLVVLRSGHTMTVASVTVTGGVGGVAGNGGSAGRVRVDAPLDSIAGAQVGPAFSIDTPLITQVHTVMLGIRIPSLIPFQLSQEDQDGTLVYISPDPMSGTGTAVVAVTLINGWNKLCLTVPGGTLDPDSDIGYECIEIAFMTP